MKDLYLIVETFLSLIQELDYLLTPVIIRFIRNFELYIISEYISINLQTNVRYIRIQGRQLCVNLRINYSFFILIMVFLQQGILLYPGFFFICILIHVYFTMKLYILIVPRSIPNLLLDHATLFLTTILNYTFMFIIIITIYFFT